MKNHSITRIHITDPITGRGADRFERSEIRQPQADMIYRAVFDRLDMPLASGGTEHIWVSKDEWEAGYDRYLGIDVHLHFANGQVMTTQEKFLYENYHHVTVEYYQDAVNRIPGDWFNLKAQLYGVFYDRHLRGDFDEWMLLNWPAFQVAIEARMLPFDVVANGKDGARASLARVHFQHVPNDVVLASKMYGKNFAVNREYIRQVTIREFTTADFRT